MIFSLSKALGTRVLVLAPHTDDGELGCGGTIAALVDAGAKVYYAAFSIAEESVPTAFPPTVLETEVRAATATLGIDPPQLLIFRYKVRHFNSHRQAILEDLVRLNQELSPQLVLMPCLTDLHQDHTTVAFEGLRAFKKTSILCYELPWNNLSFNTQGFTQIGESHLQRKVDALTCYASQHDRSYLSADFVRGLARTRGVQIGKEYAEAFEVQRLIL